MKLNRLIGKVLGRDTDKPAPPRPVARKAPPRTKPEAGANPKTPTEEQWLRVLEEAEPDHNPYDTYSWELDPGNDERRLKRQKFTSAEPPPTDRSNPYNSGLFRRGGWDG